MSKITPLMTSLHEGHKTEERLNCIDDILFRHKRYGDTKYTILQAFWWYRKNSISLDKVKKAREELYETAHADADGWNTVIDLEDALAIIDNLIESES